MIVHEDIKSQEHTRKHTQPHTVTDAHTPCTGNDLCDLQASLNVQLRGLNE